MSLPCDVIHLFYNDRHIICDHQGLKMQYSRESEYIIHLKGHTCSLVLRTIMVRSGKDIPSDRKIKFDQTDYEKSPKQV